MELNGNDMRRYARQIILPEIGVIGQNKIKRAGVLCVGAGGLGCPAMLYLAAAGVGRIGVADFDAVDLTNLQRQVLHSSADVGRAKADSAREALRRLNPEIQVQVFNEPVNAQNVIQILSGFDLVIDGTDNLAARYLINDAAVLLRKPYVYGSVFHFEGQATIFAPHLGAPCYRCLFPEPPPPGFAPSCAEAGVLGVVPGVIGMIQATEALKLLVEAGDLLLNRLLLFDALAMRFREIKITRDPACPLCGRAPTITRPVEYRELCGNSPAGLAANADTVQVQDLKQALENPQSAVQVLDIREPAEQTIAAIKGVPLLPLSQLAHRFTELDPKRTYYLFCKVGWRSAKAVEFLKQQGFKDVRSVAGGITAWSEQIDPSVPKY